MLDALKDLHSKMQTTYEESQNKNSAELQQQPEFIAYKSITETTLLVCFYVNYLILELCWRLDR